MTTIVLSNVPELTCSVNVPRIAAIEYPFGRLLGNPHDQAGQLSILKETLRALEAIQTPGDIKHLAFKWPEPARKTKVDPPKPPPIAGYLLKRPWELPRLFSRNPPQ